MLEDGGVVCGLVSHRWRDKGKKGSQVVSWEAGVTGWDCGVGGHEVRNQRAELEVTDVAPKTGHPQVGDEGKGQETLG